MSLTKFKAQLKKGKPPTGGYIQEKIVRNNLLEAIMNGGMFSKVESKIVVAFGETNFSFKGEEANKAEQMLAKLKLRRFLTRSYATSLS